jgi:2-(3-amino-3-carboxypropyl)histidine synthase
MQVVFVPCYSNVELKRDFLNRLLKEVKQYNAIGLVTITQFFPQFAKLQKYLASNGKKTLVSYGRHSSFKGQILGCDVSAAERVADAAECFLYLGTGRFHPIMVASKLSKPVICADPLTGDVSAVSEKDVRSYKTKLLVMKNKVLESKRIGILVSIKRGQCNMLGAKEMKRQLTEQGKSAHIFIFDTLVPEQLLDFTEIDAWVNTACERIFDDSERFERPVINLNELQQ